MVGDEEDNVGRLDVEDVWLVPGVEVVALVKEVKLVKEVDTCMITVILKGNVSERATTGIGLIWGTGALTGTGEITGVGLIASPGIVWALGIPCAETSIRKTNAI